MDVMYNVGDTGAVTDGVPVIGKQIVWSELVMGVPTPWKWP